MFIVWATHIWDGNGVQELAVAQKRHHWFFISLPYLKLHTFKFSKSLRTQTGIFFKLSYCHFPFVCTVVICTVCQLINSKSETTEKKMIRGGVKIHFLLHFYYQIFSARGVTPPTPLNRPMVIGYKGDSRNAIKKFWQKKGCYPQMASEWPPDMIQSNGFALSQYWSLSGTPASSFVT